jgi:hypothetical protein
MGALAEAVCQQPPPGRLAVTLYGPGVSLVSRTTPLASPLASVTAVPMSVPIVN